MTDGGRMAWWVCEGVNRPAGERLHGKRDDGLPGHGTTDQCARNTEWVARAGRSEPKATFATLWVSRLLSGSAGTPHPTTYALAYLPFEILSKRTRTPERPRASAPYGRSKAGSGDPALQFIERRASGLFVFWSLVPWSLVSLSFDPRSRGSSTLQGASRRGRETPPYNAARARRIRNQTCS